MSSWIFKIILNNLLTCSSKNNYNNRHNNNNNNNKDSMEDSVIEVGIMFLPLRQFKIKKIQ